MLNNTRDYETDINIFMASPEFKIANVSEKSYNNNILNYHP